ncbi:hypothetical protein [Tateyamaria sp. SN3-11]|uniref:hypothetical protein n=1 Tax=Tateyamaria sp. SN3-11 TaxID=3092147 RepID=UPI0039EC8C21
MSAESWHNATLALRLLALDPAGLGGAVIRMRASPDRDALLAEFDSPLPLRKLPNTISDEQLFGGIDLSATLASSQVIENPGFFQSPCIALLPMAERCPPALAAKLAALADQSLTQGFLALDEGIDLDERTPDTLSDRLAFHISPEGRKPPVPAGTSESVPAGTRLADDDASTQLTLLAARFGIPSLRAPTLALKAARAHAKLMGREALTDTDISIAAALVYPHRATILPQDEAPENDPLPRRLNRTLATGKTATKRKPCPTPTCSSTRSRRCSPKAFSTRLSPRGQPAHPQAQAPGKSVHRTVVAAPCPRAPDGSTAPLAST